MSGLLFWGGKMYTIDLKNCGNIIDGSINLEESKLNIKLGINGTGKSTISKCLKHTDGNSLDAMQSFYTEEKPEIKVTPNINEVLSFDEDFVSQLVFVNDEVIGNSFEVFIKTPNYEEKRKRLEDRLEKIHKTISTDAQILKLRQIINEVNSKFNRTTTGSLSATGMLKSIINRQSAVIPHELNQYESFINNSDINIPWIDWKGKGDKFDISDKCPYCAEDLNRPQQDLRKKVFKDTYSKADSQNLADMLKFLEELREFLDEDKYSTLVDCVKQNIDKDRIQLLFGQLCSEFSMILSRYNKIEEFGRRKIAIADISNLDQSIQLMRFPQEDFQFFTCEYVKEVFSKTNELADQLLRELIDIKREMGELKGVLRATVEESQKDINDFLKMAGINYEIDIEVEDENEAKTVLKQLYSDSPTEVQDIKKHLSWGEKNAFALILFMYWAVRQEPDLIILDDPISSFDSNKKYALMHRLFMKYEGPNKVSLYGKTVLMLTHDFEPITDFIVLGKINPEKVSASYIWNRKGFLQEKRITSDNDIVLILKECEEIASDIAVNRIVRVAFLRKLCELNQFKEDWNYTYQILSSLIHGEHIRRKVGNDSYVEMDVKEIEKGLAQIRVYIPDFDYENELKNSFTEQNIKELYKKESNNYYKICLFREITELCPNIKIDQKDNGWFKYVDETYHIENDNLHCLDVRKFEVVPDYIIEMVNIFMVN